MLPDAHLAEDVTQSVFVALAQNASALLAHPFLSGWLHRTARNLAAKTVRAELARRAREQDAASMKALLATEPETSWDHIAPHLDHAIGELRDSERDALLLRFFERKSAREIGQTLGITEQAAQKRVNRAVESLREFFATRGIAVGSSALMALLAARGVEAAPIGLAATVCTSAALTGATVHTSTNLLLTKAITMTGIQKTLIGAALAASLGGTWYQARDAGRLRERLAALERADRQQIQQLQDQREQLAAKVAALSTDNQRGQSNLNELLRLRGELARLRAANNDAAAVKMTAPTGTPDRPQSSIAIPKDSWADAGLETPEAALKTRGWCIVNGNRERFKQSIFLTDAARKTLEDMFVRMAEQSRDPNKEQTIRTALEHNLGVEDGILMPMTAENQQKGYTGYRVLSDQSAGDDERLLQVQTSLADGSAKQENLRLRRVGTEWKVVIDEDFVKGLH